MSIFRYLTHPQVIIDPSIDVRQWGLSDEGRARAEAFARSPLLMDTARIFTSPERKALETSDIIASRLGIVPQVLERSHENDRSATGYLSDEGFAQNRDKFFASPDTSAKGWETANDAQTRIVVTVFEAIMQQNIPGDILCIGHGTVGTLLYCDAAGLPISIVHDQRLGGGCVFAVDMESDEVLHHWKPIEALLGEGALPDLGLT